MQAPQIPDIHYTTLPDKVNCPTAYTFSEIVAHESNAAIWIVFINGLGLPQAFWQPSIQLVKKSFRDDSSFGNIPNIAITTYDRYAQGLSQIRDGSTPLKHDLMDSVKDLDGILTNVYSNHLSNIDQSQIDIIFVAHSIGVPLLRLFLDQTTAFRPRVAGSIFLDSNIANTDLASLLPDPDDPAFNPADLPTDTTEAELRWARENYSRMFAPTAPNTENLDRSTLPNLLPFADRPVLKHSSRGELRLIVVAHDPEAFAQEGLKIATKGLTKRYIEPAWHEYNLGLLKLVSQAEGIVVARGAGHFVQRDNPECVASEICKMIESMVGANGRDR